MAIWLALGAQDVINMLQHRLKFQYVWVAIALVTIIPIFYYSVGQLDRHEYNWSKRYAENVLNSVPENSVLFVTGDVDVGTIAYFHYIEHLRPDITLINTSGLVLNTR